ncbi:sporulation initiation inhibitor protein soj [Candidatus Omnitrophus magneticus]|uniref:Sporulation initiation inhibitor protein soj n=1 Tax=Candidatus Omnitrophus magneticus TaxID=1609969 RepID=A0A0F0CMM0_9BACT|nr:sporulation initiation inhibitor protein soj [Candidatus Omnitrophus magneticus]
MKIIPICNQKGGVAKTTTAINISVYLALKGQKTLLIDLDPQANATSGVGVEKKEGTTIYNVLHGDITIEQAQKNTGVEKLSLISSDISLTGAEVELVSMLAREHRLKKALNDVREKFDFVIIDCPPSLGLLTINALTAATSVIIPIQCEYYALEGVIQLVNTINLIKNNLNNEMFIEGVLLTMADYRTKLTKEVIDEVRKHFGEKVYKTVIPRAIKLTEAPGFGKPIALYAPDSPGAKKYEEVVCEILKIPIERSEIEGIQQEV